MNCVQFTVSHIFPCHKNIDIPIMRRSCLMSVTRGRRIDTSKDSMSYIRCEMRVYREQFEDRLRQSTFRRGPKSGSGLWRWVVSTGRWHSGRCGRLVLRGLFMCFLKTNPSLPQRFHSEMEVLLSAPRDLVESQDVLPSLQRIMA